MVQPYSFQYRDRAVELICDDCGTVLATIPLHYIAKHKISVWCVKVNKAHYCEVRFNRIYIPQPMGDNNEQMQTNSSI